MPKLVDRDNWKRHYDNQTKGADYSWGFGNYTEKADKATQAAKWEKEASDRGAGRPKPRFESKIKQGRKPPAPVERWKLTPELLDIEKAYRKRKDLSEMLKNGIVMESQKLNVMTTALSKVQKQQDMLLKMVPSERTEVDGTPMPDDIDLSINY